MEELKPCAFCGKQVAEITNCIELEDCANFEACDNCGFVCVVCSANNGGCGATGGYAPNEKQAVEKWNCRTAPENKPLTLDQLRKMDGEPVWINNINFSTRSGWNLVWVGEGDTFVIAADGCKIPLDCLGTRIPYARKPEQEESK